jgi:ribosomal protein S18 acetylase RimI-like enzyme
MIREALASDAPALLDLVTRAYRGDASRAGWTTEADLIDGPRTDLAMLHATLADPAARMLVAEEDGALHGTVTITRTADGVAQLGMLAVDPGLQARGLGGRLVGAAEEVARRDLGAHTLEMLVLSPRAELIAWYVRRGYALNGESRPFPHGDPRFGSPRDPGLAFTVLAKPLSPVPPACR